MEALFRDTAVLDLNKISDAREFNRIVAKSTCQVTLTSGEYVVDAKSLMGIFSLDLSYPTKCSVLGEKRDVGRLIGELHKFRIDEE